MDLYAIKSYFNFVRCIFSLRNSVFWDTIGDLNRFNSCFNKKMLLSFGYIEGLFNGQYILLANRGDLNFIFIFLLGEVAFIKMLRQK